MQHFLEKTGRAFFRVCFYIAAHFGSVPGRTQMNDFSVGKLTTQPVGMVSLLDAGSEKAAEMLGILR